MQNGWSETHFQHAVCGQMAWMFDSLYSRGKILPRLGKILPRFENHGSIYEAARWFHGRQGCRKKKPRPKKLSLSQYGKRGQLQLRAYFFLIIESFLCLFHSGKNGFGNPTLITCHDNVNFD